MSLILRNIALGITLAAPIGPASVAVLQNGLRRGFSQGFLTGLGVTMADASYLLLVFFGLSGLLQIRWIQSSVWFLGASALLYFGARSLREARADIGLEREASIGARNPVVAGYLINVSNPLAVVWWLGVFGSLLVESEVAAERISALASSATILIGILLWHTTMATFAHWGGGILNARIVRAITGLAGVALILFGLWFGARGIVTAFQL